MSIYEKLLKVQSTLKAPKNQYNKFGNFNYRNCEDILEAAKPLLSENKLSLTLEDNIVLVHERYYIESTVTLVDLEDNSKITNKAYAREEESKKGMDGSQVTGASSSYARKYALNGLFLIDDNKDSDTTNQGEDKTPVVDKGTGNKANTGKVTKKMVDDLVTIAAKKGYEIGKVKALVLKKYSKTTIEKLTPEEYKEVLTGYSKLPDKEEGK